MSVVLQCPVCSGSFQVTPDQAGQLVECPSCQQTISVPKEVVPVPEKVRQEVVDCPKCAGEFSIGQEMRGTEVACPHCESHVKIGPSTDDNPAPVLPPKIRTGKRKRKSKVDLKGIDLPANEAAMAKPSDLLPPPKSVPVTTTSSVAKPEIRKPAGAVPAMKKQNLAENNLADSAANKRRQEKQSDSTSQQFPPVQPAIPEKASPTKSGIVEQNDAQHRDGKKPRTIDLTNPIDKRLPPKFTAVDPEETFAAESRGAVDHKVILPDGEGGYQRIDSRVVHVERDGQKVQLYASPKEKKERRRLVQNMIAIVIGIALLGVAFYFLLNW